jgi:hypothetical protein
MNYNGDPIKPFDKKAFKDAIAMVESAGGKYMSNPSSDAAGRYHFIYRLLTKENPDLAKITKLEFMKDHDLQEEVMERALNGTLKGYPNYIEKAKEYQSLYAPDLTVEETAAMIHFLGSGGARQALKGDYQIPGQNLTKEQYISKFRKHYKPSIEQDRVESSIPGMPIIEQKIDNTAVAMPQINPGYSEEIMPDKRTMPEYREDPFLETSYEGSSENDVISWLQNQKNAYGGQGLSSGDTGLIRYDNGGTHEQNPNGGVPIGIGSNGKMNTVEEGETQFNFDGKDYIFSDRIGLNTIYKK